MIKIEQDFMEELDNYISELRELYNVPGISVAITQNDKIIYSKTEGYSDIENKEEIYDKTLFPIGSLTKSFTAAAVGILVDEGKLDLDTPINEYINDFEMYNQETTKKITMRDILSHRTGLSKHLYWWYNYNVTRKDLVSKIKYLEPVKECCSDWEYTNVMYIFVGYLIEKLEGITWETFIDERILKPLKMHDSFVTPNEIGCMNRLASPYGIIDEKINKLELPNLYSVAPAGSMVSTVEDVAKWAMFNMGIEQSGDKIISKEYLLEMQNKQVDASLGLWHFKEVKDAGYGLGWFIERFKDEKLIYHSGNIDGFSSQLTLIPKKNVSIIILTNLHNSFLSYGLTYYICDMLVKNKNKNWGSEIYKNSERMKKMMDSMKLISFEKERKIKNTDNDFTAFEGKYYNQAYGDINIKQSKWLILKLNNREYDLLHYKCNTFVLNHKEYGIQLPVNFITNENGVVSMSVPFGLHPSLKEIEFIKV